MTKWDILVPNSQVLNRIKALKFILLQNKYCSLFGYSLIGNWFTWASSPFSKQTQGLIQRATLDKG